jgi:Amt family ammonium transporter
MKGKLVSKKRRFHEFSWLALRIGLLVILLAALPLLAGAQEEEPTLEEKVASVTDGLNYVWTLIAAFLVFFMQAGFAMVEAGFTRAKNAVNIMMKNLLDFCMGSLAYFFFGFAIMFGATSGGLFGTTGFMLGGLPDSITPEWAACFLIFQTVFAATAATIVSGAMAERTKFISYLIYSFVISALIYPLFGHWAWGNLLITDNVVWLANKGYIDFAGSGVVHMVGGVAGLAGALVLGPRVGKYREDGKMTAFPGHNIPLAALGVFILWFGWFGFNPGSTTSGTNLSIATIAVNTNLAAAAGAIAAMITVWITLGKPDCGMTLNGALAGLVGITAPCANVSAASSVVIGLIAGVLVVFSCLFFDKIKIDDPVGAISVHGVCGAWGVIAAALFDAPGGVEAFLSVQLQAVGVCFIWTFATAMALFLTLKFTVGLRVSEEEEIEGLDYGEHGANAYPNFEVSFLK